MANPITIRLDLPADPGTPGASRTEPYQAGFVVTAEDPANIAGGGTWQWYLTPPSGSIAALVGDTTASPTFTTDIPGTYLVFVEYDDGALTKSWVDSADGGRISAQGGLAFQQPNGNVIPTQGETIQFGNWNAKMDDILRPLDAFITDPSVGGVGAASMGTTVSNGRISGKGPGSLALGYAGTDSFVETMASSKGSLAVGYAINMGEIYTVDQGGFAHGVVKEEGAQIVSGHFGSFAGGYALGAYGGHAEIHGWDKGAFAHGYVNLGYVLSLAKGSTATGYAYNQGSVSALGDGAVASGSAMGPSCSIIASKRGSHVSGASYNGYIWANGNGSIAFGYSYAGDIQARGVGSLAGGYTRPNGTIYSNGKGSLAVGYAKSFGEVTARGKGAMAIGYGSTYRLYANYAGAGAFGAARYADINANAIGAFQFGEGTNAIEDSVKIGAAGLRFRGVANDLSAGAANGDFAILSGDVLVRTGGAVENLSGVGRLPVSNTWTKSQTVAPEDLGTVSGAIAVDADLSNVFDVVVNGASTIGAPTNLKDGQDITMRVKQDGAGSRAVTFNAVWDFGNEAAPDTSSDAAGSRLIVTGTSDGTNVFCSSKKGFTN